MAVFTQRAAAMAFAIGVLAFGGGASVASAQTFPDHAVKIIVPTAAGGAIDLCARVIGEKLQAKWGKPIVIENRPGASMRIGAEAVQKSPADGYTLLVAHDGTMAINPLVFPDLPYDPQKDFTPLGLVVAIPEALMVSVKEAQRLRFVRVNRTAEQLLGRGEQLVDLLESRAGGPWVGVAARGAGHAQEGQAAGKLGWGAGAKRGGE